MRLKGSAVFGSAAILLLVSCKSKPNVAPEGEPGAVVAQGGVATKLPDSPQITAASELMHVPKLHDAATTYQVSYTPETVIVSPDAVKTALKDVSDDGAAYTFDSSSSDAQKFHAGSVMLLSGVALRKVTSTAQTSAGIVVQTEPAAVTDAIADGNIEATQHVDFSSMQASLEDQHGEHWSLLPVVEAQGKGTVAGGSTFGNGPKKFTMQIDPFQYTITFTPAPGQMNVDMTISDTVAQLSFAATGYIKNYDALMNVLISNRSVTKMDYSSAGMESDLKVTWTAASVVAGPMAKIGSWTEKIKELPALKSLAITVPFTIGPIPFSLKFSGGIIFTPAFTSKNTLLDGSLSVHYTGSAGFTVNKGTSSTTGSILQSAPANPTTKIISLGPIGFTVAVEFVRAEVGLGIGVVTFSPAVYVSPVTSFGIVYGGPAAMLPCETHILDVSVNTGISAASTVFSFFGSSGKDGAGNSIAGAAAKFSVDKQVYKKNFTGPKPGMMLCPK